MTQPRSFTVAATRAWILDGSRTLEADADNLASALPIALPGQENAVGVLHLAAADDQTLIIATQNSLQAFHRSASGTYALLWHKNDFQHIADVADSAHSILVADTEAGTVVLLSQQTGAVLAGLTAASIPGGLRPVALAAQGSWCVVADSAGKRLVRLHVP